MNLMNYIAQTTRSVFNKIMPSRKPASVRITTALPDSWWHTSTDNMDYDTITTDTTDNTTNIYTLPAGTNTIGSVSISANVYGGNMCPIYIDTGSSTCPLVTYIDKVFGYTCIVHNGMIICEDLGIIFRYGKSDITQPFPDIHRRCRTIEVNGNITLCDFLKMINTILVYNDNKQNPIPNRKYDSVGFDLYCAIDMIIKPEDMVDVPTGTYCALPTGVWGLLIHRSSIFKKRLTTHTAIIDPGYQGELFVCCYNWGKEPFHVKVGDRLAQFIPMQDVPGVSMKEVKDVGNFPSSTRGDKGFGSTGT